MSVKGTTKEGAGFIEEEIGEMIGDMKMAKKGRKLRNEGRRENGQPAKTTLPGSGN